MISTDSDYSAALNLLAILTDQGRDTTWLLAAIEDYEEERERREAAWEDYVRETEGEG